VRIVLPALTYNYNLIQLYSIVEQQQQHFTHRIVITLICKVAMRAFKRLNDNVSFKRLRNLTLV